MIFVCDCGKKYKAPAGTPPTGHACPHCGGPLRAHDTSSRTIDLKVLLEQKKALRDELRLRDRQFRIAQGEINKLKAENEQLQEELRRARGGAYVTISEAPVIVDRSTDSKPLEMPIERLDLSLVPVLEEIPNLADAPRLPLYTPTQE